jgi:hypothetical protein
VKLSSTILALVSCVAACNATDHYVEIVDVQPVIEVEHLGATGEPPWDEILGSLRSHGPVHAIAFYGDHDPQVQQHHREILRYLGTPGTQLDYHTGCSMFHFAAGDSTDLVGRNFDNVFADLLVGWFYPPDGYPSITLFPLHLFGFDENVRFDSGNPAHRNLVLGAPRTSVEGMNEAGVSITLASLHRSPVSQVPGREPRFFLHLVREILDHAGSVEEAIAITERYNVFDNGRAIISHHMLVAGPGEESVVLEWRDGDMHVVRDGPQRQVVTNSDMLDVSQRARRENCPRYRRIAYTLDDLEKMDWRQGLDVLASASQEGGEYVIDGRRMLISTQWSAMFDLRAREILLCMHRDYGTVYRLRFPEFTDQGP